MELLWTAKPWGVRWFSLKRISNFFVADPAVRAQNAVLMNSKKKWKHQPRWSNGNLAHRDHIDSTREHSPLRKAADAIEIDNTHLNKEEQIEVILKYLNPTA